MREPVAQLEAWLFDELTTTGVLIIKYLPMNTDKAKRVFYSVVLMAIAVVGTWATMTIMQLKLDNSRLEEQVNQLKTSKVILDANATLLEEQNQALQNHPLNPGR